MELAAAGHSPIDYVRESSGLPLEDRFTIPESELSESQEARLKSWADPGRIGHQDVFAVKVNLQPFSGVVQVITPLAGGRKRSASANFSHVFFLSSDDPGRSLRSPNFPPNATVFFFLQEIAGLFLGG